MTEVSGIRTAGLRVLDVYFFTGPSRRVLSRMRVQGDNLMLIVVLGGVYTATVDTEREHRTIRAVPGDVVCWSGQCDHTDESTEGRPLRCICINFRWPDAPRHLPFLANDSDHLMDLLAHRLVALAHDPVRKASLGAEVNLFLAAILAEFVLRARTDGDELLAQVARYAEEHIHEPILLKCLARCVGLEKNHFCRKYRQLTGQTPMQDVKRRKAAYAKHILLFSPTRTLPSVAGLVGVKNVATLSRLLIRHVGASARDIKKAARRAAARRPHPSRQA